jgi:hypothetical protein
MDREALESKWKANEADEPEPFDAEDCVWGYRHAHKTGDTDRATGLREQWKHSQGEDSLHETAFGAPVDRKALDERLEKLLDRYDRAVDRYPPELCEMEWPEYGAPRCTYELRNFENADTRESAAALKEWKWLFMRGKHLLAEDADTRPHHRFPHA